MNINNKIKLIESISKEIIGIEKLKNALKNEKEIWAYDGFEPSGKLHIAQGLMRVSTINQLIDLGINFKILLADWLAFANNKLDGDLDKIKKVSKYYQHVWRACGLREDKIEYLWTSDFAKDPNYWFLVLRITKEVTVNRMVRCSQVMGRNSDYSLSVAQIIYPSMQAADIFYINADVAQMGMDQRKVNMLTREVAPHLGFKKPLVIHHHMLMGLRPDKKEIKSENKIEKQIEIKMSKSDEDTAIFMSDDSETIEKKISNAYCPPKDKGDNPVLEYYKYIVFKNYQKVKIKRKEKYGGNVFYDNYLNLENDYIKGKLYPLDLKNNLSRYLNLLLNPVREYFKKNKSALKLQDEILSWYE